MNTMIIDSIEHIYDYAPIVPGMIDGLNYYESVKNLAPGRYTDGRFIVILQKGVTKEIHASDFEAHIQYIDIQIVTLKAEKLIWADIAALQETVPYDFQKDVAFYTGKGTDCIVHEGMFYIAFPHDGHTCCGDIGSCHTDFKKACIKIPCTD